MRRELSTLVPSVRFEGKLPLSEVFYSVQGEGRFAGVPAIFIRLSYCNLNCSWCDTKYAINPDVIEVASTQEILVAADGALTEVVGNTRGNARPHVIITGGEPMLHQSELPNLINTLREGGFNFIELETNCTIVPNAQMIELVSWWNCSPKLSNSGVGENKRMIRAAIDTTMATGRADFKFVVVLPKDINEIVKYYASIIPHENILLMAEGSTLRRQQKAIPWIMEACAKYGFRFSPRLHVHAWGNTMKK